MPDVTGRCCCGGVSYTLTGAKSAQCCHCSICRRVTGAPFISVTGVKPEQADVTLEDGIHLDTYATSSYLTRKRCSRCGAAVFNAVRLKNGMAFDNFMVGLLDDPSALARTHHIYYADRIVDVDDDLPKFDAFGRP